VIFMAGWALVCFSVFYWLMDVKGHARWGKPFVIYGMNAIAVFVLSGIVGRLITLIKFAGPDGAPETLKGFIYRTVFVPYFSPVNASTAFAIAFILVMYLVVWGMWKKSWFIKV